jgi:hypothetical protein
VAGKISANSASTAITKPGKAIGSVGPSALLCRGFSALFIG